MSPVTLLFLAANPAATTPLALDEEVRGIEAMLRASQHRDAVRIVSKWAVRSDDLQQHLLEQCPTVVHFSCHGDVDGGLLLADEEGMYRSVPPAAMAELFRLLRGDVRLVVFNACDSLAQAEAVAREVDCVIGMRSPIGDRAARAFSVGFYSALGFGLSVARAFALGCNAMLRAGLPESQTPRLLTRPGVDADAVYIVGAPAGRLPPAGSSRRIALLAAREDAPSLALLKRHLRPLERKEGFEVWEPSMVPPGARRREAVDEGVAAASVVVVFASPALLADDEFVESRLPELIVRESTGAVRLLALVVSACDIASTDLDIYRPLNEVDRPLDAMSTADQHQLLLMAARQIANAVKAPW